MKISKPSPRVSARKKPSAPKKKKTTPEGFRAKVSRLSARPTVTATALAMTTSGNVLNSAMKKVKPAISLESPSISGTGPMIPQVVVGPVTQIQVDQLQRAGFSIDCFNPLSQKKGELANDGLRDGNTLWRVAVKPTGDGRFTLGFYGEALPQGAPDGQGAVKVPFTKAVIRAGGDQPVGEQPSLLNRLGGLLFKAGRLLRFPNA